MGADIGDRVWDVDKDQTMLLLKMSRLVDELVKKRKVWCLFHFCQINCTKQCCGAIILRARSFDFYHLSWTSVCWPYVAHQSQWWATAIFKFHKFGQRWSNFSITKMLARTGAKLKLHGSQSVRRWSWILVSIWFKWRYAQFLDHNIWCAHGRFAGTAWTTTASYHQTITCVLCLVIWSSRIPTGRRVN